MTSGLRQSLIDGKARLGVWGTGYIGLTTMINFAQQGIYSVGYDTNPSVVESLKKGNVHIPTLNYWLGYKADGLITGMVKATTDWQDMMEEDVKVHLIAVPTERNGEPWGDPLRDVIRKIAMRKFTGIPDLVIIESTLTPGMLDDVVVGALKGAGFVVGRDILVGIAPRRDWFDSPDKNLKTLARVIGGTNTETSQAMKEVLGIICDNLIVVPDTHVVEMVKAVENSILHICATYACQVAAAYPDVDVGEVFRLAGTHWRIPTYYPSVGTGGYCIPLSSKYIRDGATRGEYLKLTEETIRSDSLQPMLVADMMAQRTKGGRIGVLGLSYKRDLRVHTLSPALSIIKHLVNSRVEVKAFDPYYSAMDTYQVAGVERFQYPDELADFDGIIIVPPHRIFGQTPKGLLFKCLRKGQHILDNEGIWEKWRSDFGIMGVDYHRVGDKGWCLI